MYTEELLEEARKLAIELRGKERNYRMVYLRLKQSTCANKVKSK